MVGDAPLSDYLTEGTGDFSFKGDDGFTGDFSYRGEASFNGVAYFIIGEASFTEGDSGGFS